MIPEKQAQYQKDDNCCFSLTYCDWKLNEFSLKEKDIIESCSEQGNYFSPQTSSQVVHALFIAQVTLQPRSSTFQSMQKPAIQHQKGGLLLHPQRSQQQQHRAVAVPDAVLNVESPSSHQECDGQSQQLPVKKMTTMTTTST